MKYNTDQCKIFQNDNINVKLDPWLAEKWQGDIFGAVNEALGEITAAFVGEPFCFGNFEMARIVYCFQTGKCYLFFGSMLDTLRRYRNIKLVAYNPDDAEKEIVNDHFQYDVFTA